MEELHSIDSTADMIGMIKSRMIRWKEGTRSMHKIIQCTSTIFLHTP